MLKPEEREAPERQMKEINAAYAVLKRVRRDLTGWQSSPRDETSARMCCIRNRSESHDKAVNANAALA